MCSSAGLVLHIGVGIVLMDANSTRLARGTTVMIMHAKLTKKQADLQDAGNETIAEVVRLYFGLNQVVKSGRERGRAAIKKMRSLMTLGTHIPWKREGSGSGSRNRAGSRGQDEGRMRWFAPGINRREILPAR